MTKPHWVTIQKYIRHSEFDIPARRNLRSSSQVQLLDSWFLDIGRKDTGEEVSPSPHHSCGTYFLPTSDFSTTSINFPGRDSNSLYATVHVTPLRIVDNSVISTTTTTTTTATTITTTTTMLACLGEFENPGQLSIQEVLGGTDDCVLKIFIISWIFEVTKHGNSVEMSAMDFLKEAPNKPAYGMLRTYRKCQYPTWNCMGGWWRTENLSWFG